jgi:hypothetical protein
MLFRVIQYLKHGTNTIDIIESQFNEIKKSKKVCLFARELEEKLILLLENYYEFETELLKLAETFRIWGHRDYQISMEERLLLDRRLVNLLTACKLYVDQTLHGISSLYGGKKSTEFTTVNTLTNNFYDNHFGYRFMEALRNHVQHAGLPIHVITRRVDRVRGKEEEYIQFTVIPLSKTQLLAENSEFKKLVLKELKDNSNEIDLRPATREYVSCLIELHENIRSIIAEQLQLQRQKYEFTISQYSSHDGRPVHAITMFKIGGENQILERIDLVPDILTHLDSLYKRNLPKKNLVHSSSANSSQKPAG